MKINIKKLIPKPFISFYHFALSLLSAMIYGFPSKNIKLIGITGTNGKTTVSEMIVKILEEQNIKVALINSMRFKIDNQEQINYLRMTMPGRFFIQRFLRESVNKGCQYAVMEVTSEGVKQHRHCFLNFQTAIFTNLSPEHIESHGSFKKYCQAKIDFFKTVKNIHIINKDDEQAKYFIDLPCQNKILYSIQDITNINFNNNQITFQLNTVKFCLDLFGQFNIYNALAAVCFAKTQDISLKLCARALEKIKNISGRMELVVNTPFTVFVDYAFTPNALEKVYQAMQNLKPDLNSNLIAILGSCGGGRDTWKRPVLGSLAKKYCDQVIITNEDPYDEDPMEIIKQVAQGAGSKAKIILDRRTAISTALKLAKKNDIIIITGKGCEPSMCVKGKKIPWNEVKVVKEEFQKIYSGIV